jgi:uncharacterized membrane protein
MPKNRLEAFSDGVIAILITIMVLELKPPEALDHDGGKSPWIEVLHDRAPLFYAYVLSFVFLAIYWNNHHHLLHTAKRVTGRILWANTHLLFWLSLVPFTTAWLGPYHEDAVPTAAYGVVLLMSAIAYTLLAWSIIAVEGRESVLAQAMGRDVKGKLSLGLYAAGIVLSFVNVWIADAIYVLVAIIWLVPDKRIERLKTEQ